jgi:hypothetical protein
VTATVEAPEQAVSPLWRGPGTYSADELSLEDYHRDIVPGGSLSSSGARKLLDPGCPAIFDYERRHPQPPKKEFDIGSAAHKLVLGEGPDLAMCDVSDWRTKDAQKQATEARERGAIPLKRADYEQVHAMADALRRHTTAAALFDPAGGKPEQSLYWVDPITKVTCRARPDWLPNPGRGRLIIPDYKTTTKVDRKSISKAIRDWGYHCQAAWYLEGARRLGLADEYAVFVLVFQTKTPPYLVVAAQVDSTDLRIGHAKNQVALDIYRQCTESGDWPAYGEGVEIIPQPEWDQKNDIEEYL